MKLDPRIRELHLARYGATDEIDDYLRTLENLRGVPDDKRGENHHMLAKFVWGEYANLKENPWNRLRVSRAIHVALTELQSRFEERLRIALLLMKGQSQDAHITACRLNGRRNVESGHLARLRTPEHQRAASKRRHELYPNLSRETAAIYFTPKHQRAAAKLAGQKNVESGHLDRIRPSKASLREQLALARTPEHQRAAGRVGGKVGGKSRSIAKIAACCENLKKSRTPEHQRVASQAANHLRWHLNRVDGFNPACALCFQVV